MIGPLSISRLILDTVPQLYEASAGPHLIELPIRGEKGSIFSLVRPSVELKKYLEDAVAIWEELSPMTEGDISQIIEREWIQQKFIVSWLESRTKIRSWPHILDYVRRLSRRLTENQAMSKTMVIEPGVSKASTANLANPEYFKVFDWLGSSNHTYFRVSEDLAIQDFESLPMGMEKEPSGFRFYPDELHPLISSLKNPHAVVVHLSLNGSILIADSSGLIASKRALESWTIYDVKHVIASVAEAMKRRLENGAYPAEPECVACSLFQIVFDISMKRHGGLLILDDPRNIGAYVAKGIERDSASPLNVVFTHSAFSGLVYSIPEARKLVELSSIDGALILDLHGNLLQVGSMIMSHPTTPNRFGMREAAAYSATKNGATAFKVSADGHMTMYFTTPELTGTEVHQFDFR